MRAMLADESPELSQFRVTLFVGPQPVEGKPFTYSCVFNVKKRSWKGGIQVGVEIDQTRIDAISIETGFPSWLTDVLIKIAPEDRHPYQKRAEELFIQAVCWRKLDLLLQSGISQHNQCLAADTLAPELNEAITRRRDFFTTYIASELDLLQNDTAPSS
jgi:hypothetical protein